MQIIFKRIKKDNKIVTEPLFAWNDSSYKSTSLETILENMNNLSDENTCIFALYAGNHEFEDCPPRYERSETKDIEILVKIIDNHVKEILKTGERYSNFDEIAELLNKEVKAENVRYEMFRVRGKLK